ncbi:type II toxin-antitoxin system VapC family toxin [Candidatus Margulisiibacteriota bacterium]
MYILDTCVISELTKKKPHKNVVNFLNKQDQNRLFISALTIGEIEKGITKLKDQERKLSLTIWLKNELYNYFNNKIIPINQDISRVWGILAGNNEINAKPSPIIDGLIAASAILVKATIITRNEKDFSFFPVKIINPWPKPPLSKT